MENINWFPGHMAKARAQLTEQLKRVDIVIEICDARLPYSSRNPELEKMIAGKRRILFLNKADLADPIITEKWLRFFRQQGMLSYAINANRLKPSESIQKINDLTHDLTSAALRKGMRRTIRAMSVGVPNVGKTTYINRINGHSALETADRPGITRANRWVRISPYLEMLDTPGLLWPKIERQESARRLCYIGSVSDSAVDTEELAEHLLRDLMSISSESVIQRFHIKKEGIDTGSILEEVCYRRGYLLKGGKPDISRCSAIVLDEFRGGKLGRITLENPDENDFDQKAGDMNDKD